MGPGVGDGELGETSTNIVLTSCFIVSILQCLLLSKLLGTMLSLYLCVSKLVNHRQEPPVRIDPHLDQAPTEILLLALSHFLPQLQQFLVLYSS